MPKPSVRQQLDALFEKLWPEMAQAFREAIAEIKSRITLKALVDRLKAGDINGALDALNIDRAAFAAVEDQVTLAFQSGGSLMAQNMPTMRDYTGTKVVIRFDMRATGAETILKEQSSKLVTNIVSEQLETLRSTLQSGLAAGQNPTQTALEVVGRVNRATRKREGGILGLSAPQSEYVETARQELLSSDPALLRNYLLRGRRDKRFDRTVQAALEAGRPLPVDTVNKIVDRYSDGLLKLRGDVIGRTETLTSMNAAGHEAFRQGMAKTNYTGADVIRTWDSAGDGRVRHTHAVLNGQKVRGLDAVFQSPSGARMRYPGDTSLGAGASEVIGCRCRCAYRIDPFGGSADG